MGIERVLIVVEEDGTRIVSRRFDQLSDSSKRTALALRQPRKGLKDFDRQAKKTAVTQKALVGQTNLLRRAFLALGGVFIIRELIEQADAYTQVQNRLRLVTQETEELTAVTSELLAISNRTRSSFAANAELFNRVSLATRELGLSQQDVLNVTESLNQAVILSGASAQEASAGLIQLSQGLASGALRGDELRSVLEQLPAVADVIAKELGVTRGALRDMGKEGKITAEVVLNAFKNAREELSERFGTTVPTVAQSFQVLRNQVIAFIGELDKSLGITQALSRAIIFLGKNLDTIAKVLGSAGLLLVLRGVSTALILVRANFIKLTVAFAANPIGFLITLLTAVISLLITFSDEISATSDGLVSLADVGVVAFEELSEAASDVFEGIKDVLSEVVNFIETNLPVVAETFKRIFGDVEFSFEGLTLFFAKGLDFLIGSFLGLGAAVKATFRLLPGVLKEFAINAINAVIGVFETGIDIIVALLKTLLGSAFTPIAKAVNTIFKAMLETITFVVKKAVEFVDGLRKAIDRTIKGIKSLFGEVKRLDDEFKISPQVAGAIDDAAGRGLSALDQFGETFVKNFNEQQKTDILPLMKNSAEGSAKEFIKTFNDTFDDARQFTGLQDFATGIFDKARARADARRQAELASPSGAAVDLSAAPAGGGSGGPDRLTTQLDALNLEFEKHLSLLAQERQLLQGSAAERNVVSEMMRIENQLRKAAIKLGLEGFELGLKERILLENQIRRIQLLGQVANAVDRVRGETINLVEAQKELQIQVDQGNISIEQATLAYRSLENQSLATSRTMEDGFTRGFNRITDTLTDFATQAETTLVNAFNSAEDAFVEFTQTGKFNFKGLIDSVLADLTRLLARQALTGLLTSFFPGAGLFTAGASAAAGRQHGGPVTSNRQFLVGEQGPEIFQPRTSGTIIPAGQTAAMMGGTEGQPAAPSVTIVNVMDPSEVAAALASPEGEEIILNTIKRNKGRVSREIS